MRDLESKGCVERKAVPREVKTGRQRHYKLIIQLTPDLLNPKARVLYCLANISPLAPLNFKKGAELLTDNLVGSLLVISTLHPNPEKIPLAPDCPHSPALACYKDISERVKKVFPNYQQLISETKLDEYRFLKGLSRFNYELICVELSDRGIAPLDLKLARRGLYSYKNDFIELLKRGTEDPEVFPALGVARQTGMAEQFERMLDWIMPLIAGPEFVEARKAYREDRVKFYGGRDLGQLPGMEVKSIVWPTMSNLAGIFFFQEESNWEDVLIRLWAQKLRSSIAGRKGKGR